MLSSMYYQDKSVKTSNKMGQKSVNFSFGLAKFKIMPHQFAVVYFGSRDLVPAASIVV